MAYSITDIRRAGIAAYLSELNARACGILPPLLAGQHQAANSTAAQFLFDTLQLFSIEYESEISNRYLTPAIQQAFELRLASAFNEVNNPTNVKDVYDHAQEIFAFVQEQDKNSGQDNKTRFARESASGETYLQKLLAGRAHATMLDAEAVSSLLESAGLPNNLVGHYEAPRRNGGSLDAHDLEAIRKALTGYTDATTVVDPKQYVIVSLSQDNAHWYGNIYHLVNDQLVALHQRDYDYAMGNNTCGISAVARSLQEIERLVPGFRSQLPAPNAMPDQLSAAANALLLGRVQPALLNPAPVAHAPRNVVPATATNPTAPQQTIPNAVQADAVYEQAKLLEKISRKLQQEGKSVSADTTKQWERSQVNKNPQVQQQLQADRKLALQLAMEEVQELRINKPRR